MQRQRTGSHQCGELDGFMRLLQHRVSERIKRQKLRPRIVYHANGYCVSFTFHLTRVSRDLDYARVDAKSTATPLAQNEIPRDGRSRVDDRERSRTICLQARFIEFISLHVNVISIGIGTDPIFRVTFVSSLLSVSYCFSSRCTLSSLLYLLQYPFVISSCYYRSV